MSKKKILLQPEFNYYHEKLTEYGLRIIEELESNKLKLLYNSSLRALEFATNINLEILEFFDDGNGNVTLSLPSYASITDDGNGNVTISGVTFTDDGFGHVYIN